MTATSNIKNIPPLRFKEFKGNWIEKSLGEIFNINAGGDITPQNVSSIKTQKFQYPIYANAEKNKGFYAYSDIYKVEAGSITIAGRGANLGIAHARDHKFYPIVRLLVLKPINNENIYFSEYAINRINLLIESTGVPQLTVPQVSNYIISIPTLPEQQKIATFLSSVDEKIQQLTRKKKLLEQYKKGIMQQLFSGKLRFKDENGKRFPKWEEKRLGEVSEIIGGGTPDTFIPEYWDGDIQWYTPTEISERFVIKSKRTISKAGLSNSSAKLLPAGTILFTSRATIAELSFAMEECTTNQGFQSIIVNQKNNSEFIFYWIKKNKKAFIRKSQGSTFLEINKTEMQRMKIQIPCLKEQQKIATFLSSIDNKIENINNQITQAQSFKKGLLQQMFV